MHILLIPQNHTNLGSTRITEIKKIPLYFSLGWGFGYRLLIYFEQVNAQIDKTEVNLNHYKNETIADLFHTLLEINPNIELDKEVQKMLKQGKGKKAKE